MKQNADEKHFKVAGTKILDPNGEEFLIKGVNINGPGWIFPRDTLQDVELIVDTWRFNTVRLCAALGWIWVKDNNRDLDAIVEAFTSKNIVVILELHDWTGKWPKEFGEEVIHGINKKWVPSVQELIDYWVDTAERYKNNPYLWFNIMNEPGPDNSKNSAESWLDIHGKAVEAIRNTGAENIIVIDEHGWGQGSGYYGGKSSYDSAIISMGTKLNDKYKNLVFSLHVYSAWIHGKSRFEEYFNDAQKLGLCAILGEYGVFKDDPSTHNAIKAMYNYAIPNNIGRIYWAWDDRGLPLTLNETNRGMGGWGIDKTNGEKPGNLTWVGKLVWLDVRGLLTAPVPEYYLNLPLLGNGNFEEGMTGWQRWGNKTSVQDGASYNGSKALVVGDGGAGGAGRALELRPNKTYIFSAWGKNHGQQNPSGDVGVKIRDAANPGHEQHHTLTFTGIEWEQKSIEFTTPAELAGESVFIWKSADNSTLYLDDLTLVEAE